MQLPEQNSAGLWFYKELPEGAKQVSVAMFMAGAISKLNTPYIIYSEVYNEYQCMRVQENTHNRILPFIELNRVWLLTNKKDTDDCREDMKGLHTELQLEI